MNVAPFDPTSHNGGGGGAQAEAASIIGKRRVLIVEDETMVCLGLKANLERLGHDVVGQASTVGEATDVFRKASPDLVLMDIRLNGGDGIALASQLLGERRCPMIILSAYSDRELVDRASAAGVFGYLIKPVNPEALVAQIAVAVRRFDAQERLIEEQGRLIAEQVRLKEEQEKLIREKAELTATLETRKLVERAKGIFMKRLSLDEPEAHKRLQQESQKRRISLPELAKRIIESEEMLGGG